MYIGAVLHGMVLRFGVCVCVCRYVYIYMYISVPYVYMILWQAQEEEEATDDEVVDPSVTGTTRPVVATSSESMEVEPSPVAEPEGAGLVNGSGTRDASHMMAATHAGEAPSHLCRGAFSKIKPYSSLQLFQPTMHVHGQVHE